MILKDKNIFITGAGKGIGLSTTLESIKQGAFVYALVKSKKDKKKFKDLKNLKLFFGNVSNTSLIKRILSQSIKDKRKISGIVNNAGIRQRLNFNKISNSEIKKIFEINFFSIFFVMQIFSKYFIEKKISASIVNIGSIVGHLGFKQLSGYASTKSAIEGLTKSFANEMSDYKIPKSGNLIRWVKDEKILLLNTALTVKKGKSNSHQKIWEAIINDVIKYISDNTNNVIFLLLGNNAKSKIKFIDQDKHHIVSGVHPSPLSANRGFFNSNIFKRVDEILEEINKNPINW